MSRKQIPIDVKKLKRIVIKIGSNVLSDDKGVRASFFRELAKQVLFMKSRHIQPVIVSSGAIAAAMTFLKKDKRPSAIPLQQAYAAIGQPLLMNYYAREFQKHGMNIGQVLLTQDGLDHRQRFLNAKHALNALIGSDIVPVVNENDTVAVDEIKIGDNDQLSAHVAHLVEADLLIILSHVKGLYDGNPEDGKEHELIPLVSKINKKILACVTDRKKERSTGGMCTKLLAARYCMDYGMPVFITSGFQKDVVKGLFTGCVKGTWFVSDSRRVTARKHWIGNVRKSKGGVKIDPGAKKALVDGKKSLLPGGVISVSGQFEAGDCIEIMDRDGRFLGKGLTSYSHKDLEKIKGRKSSDIFKVLGYKNADEVVHRDNLVLA